MKTAVRDEKKDPLGPYRGQLDDMMCEAISKIEAVPAFDPGVGVIAVIALLRRVKPSELVKVANSREAHRIFEEAAQRSQAVAAMHAAMHAGKLVPIFGRKKK